MWYVILAALIGIIVVWFPFSWKEQETYIESLLAKLENSSAEDVARLRESECKLQLQVQELTRRENVLNMRLATKQEEMRNLLVRERLSVTNNGQTTRQINISFKYLLSVLCWGLCSLFIKWVKIEITILFVQLIQLYAAGQESLNSVC